MDDSSVMPPDGKGRGGSGAGVRRKKVGCPTPLNLEGVGVRGRERGFLSALPLLHMFRIVLVLRVLLWVPSRLLSRALISSSCTAVTTEAV